MVIIVIMLIMKMTASLFLMLLHFRHCATMNVGSIFLRVA